MRRTTDVTMVLSLLAKEADVYMMLDGLHGPNAKDTHKSDLLLIGHLELHDRWNRQSQQQHVSHDADDCL
jgi:hypothetical protein